MNQIWKKSLLAAAVAVTTAALPGQAAEPDVLDAQKALKDQPAWRVAGKPQFRQLEENGRKFYRITDKSADVSGGLRRVFPKEFVTGGVTLEFEARWSRSRGECLRFMLPYGYLYFTFSTDKQGPVIDILDQESNQNRRIRATLNSDNSGFSIWKMTLTTDGKCTVESGENRTTVKLRPPRGNEVVLLFGDGQVPKPTGELDLRSIKVTPMDAAK